MAAPGDTEIRLLRADEREPLLALLGAWELPAPWEGRAADFFRRYVERDPSFEARNVLVAERAGRLVACVQIFPRVLRAACGGAGGIAQVPIGGIGSVFTRPEARGQGVSSALLECARAQMRARGLELGVLFTARHGFYARLGWHSWPRPRALWRRDGATIPPEATRRIERFDPARHVDEAFALHRAHNAGLPGTCVRDVDGFRAQLAFAGNPDEDFLLARDATGALAAYVRGIVLEGLYCVTELARRTEPAGAGALADLVVALMQPRDPDPLARAGHASEALRALLVGPCAVDPSLDAALDERGVVRSSFASRDLMLSVLEPAALACRLRVPRRPGEEDAGWLARAWPPERMTFWPADRF
jgi:GNAT superfamily N-acetyltransferase